MNKRKTALITGATSGIGLELTLLLASDGLDLILVARNEERLSEVKNELSNKYQINIKTIAKDLSKPESSKEIYNETKDHEINILINNAGFGDYGEFIKSDWQTQEKMINLNIISLTHLTKFFLPQMIERKEGKILNVASTAAFQPGPYMSVYFATKAYVLSFSEALAEEIKHTGITITTLCPGPTRTGFEKESKTEAAGLFAGPNVMTAVEVASYGYRAMLKGQRIAIPGIQNKILATLAKISPSFLSTKITGYLIRK